jgi:hypothetical protein
VDSEDTSPLFRAKAEDINSILDALPKEKQGTTELLASVPPASYKISQFINPTIHLRLLFQRVQIVNEPGRF